MKLFLIALIFILSPQLSWANTLSDGDDFVVDDSLGNTNSSDYTSRVSDAPESMLQGDGTVDRETLGDEGRNVNETKGYEVTQSGGLGNANNTVSSGNSTQLVGLAMGAAFAAKCPKPGQQWACPLAVMSFADALAAGRARDNAAYTAAVLNPETGQPLNNGIWGTSEDYEIYNDQAVTGLKDLARMGFTLNPDGSVTTPNGSKLTADDFSSMESLMNKGLSQDMATQAMRGMAETQQSALAATPTTQEEGLQANAGQASGLMADQGGAGYSSGGSQAASDRIQEEVVFLDDKKKKKKKLGRMPASQAAELSKNFKGTPIGIGMADLFLIVHKKYKEKKDSKTREFITREY